MPWAAHVRSTNATTIAGVTLTTTSPKPRAAGPSPAHQSSPRPSPGSAHDRAGLVEDLVRRGALEPADLGLEALCDLVPVEAGGLAAVPEILGEVLRQIRGRLARLIERARPDRQVTEQGDVDVTRAPGRADVADRDKSANREMDVEPMAAGMPFGNPQVWEGLADRAPEALEEPPDVLAQLSRVVVSLARVRQRAEAIEPVGGAVPANPGPGTLGRILAAVGRRVFPTTGPKRHSRAKRAAAFGRVGEQGEAPRAHLGLGEFRPIFK